MKKKNSYKPVHKKMPVKTIQRSIINKLAMLLGVIIPVSAVIAYSMNKNFFSITIILSIFKSLTAKDAKNIYCIIFICISKY